MVGSTAYCASSWRWSMGDPKEDATLKSAKSELRDTMKAVPGLVVVSALWFIVLRYAFNRWELLIAFSAADRGSIASIFAVRLDFIPSFLGNSFVGHRCSAIQQFER